jgi:glycerate 2-kinase
VLQEIKVIIKNCDELATTTLKKQALKIIEAGIGRVLPGAIMKSAVSYDTVSKSLKVRDTTYSTATSRIFVIGGGKASGLMAEALEDTIDTKNILTGIVNCKGGGYRTKKIKVIKAGHPLPDKRGFNGVEQMLALKEKYNINDNDLVICLISGGGSALMPCPIDTISLEDMQRTTELLLECGAEIHEINALRKHLSRIKGGRLGEFYSPTRIVSLIISDVIGDDLDVIASGPTYPDSSTFQEAYAVLEKYDLTASIPESVLSYLKMGCCGEVAETPKSLTNCHNHIIGNNQLALEAMAKKAEEVGFIPLIVTAEQKGDTAEAAYTRAREILEGKYHGYNAILVGGETTPKLPKDAGKGGRNQHYAAISMMAMKSYPGDWLVASVGTDGSDYLPDVAGAIVDNNTLLRATSRGIDVKAYINRFDSNTLLKKTGEALIITGDTGTNVSDVMLYLLGQ